MIKQYSYFCYTNWICNIVVFAAFCLIVSFLLLIFHEIEIIKWLFLLQNFISCKTGFYVAQPHCARRERSLALSDFGVRRTGQGQWEIYWESAPLPRPPGPLPPRYCGVKCSVVRVGQRRGSRVAPITGHMSLAGVSHGGGRFPRPFRHVSARGRTLVWLPPARDRQSAADVTPGRSGEATVSLMRVALFLFM